MTDYDTILKDTLSGLTKRFEVAHGDLHRAVARLAKAVQSATNGASTLQLEVSHDSDATNEDRITYQLVLQTGSKRSRAESRTLYLIAVPMHGYPIEFSEPYNHNFGPSTVHQIVNAAELDVYFKEMISNPNSALVAMIAYIIRNRITNSRPAPPPDNYGPDSPDGSGGGDGDNIPF